MDDMIYEKLNKIKDLDDRVLLKNIMNSVFSSLETYTVDKYNYLEKRVFDEIPNTEEKYNIYSTIVNREKLNPIDEFMYPILKEDTYKIEYETKEIISSIKRKEEKLLFKIFAKCSYLKFKEFLKNGEDFKGIIKTDKKIHECHFKVVQNFEYIKRVEQIYKNFINNNIKWTTVNNPYINKIASVILLGCDDEIESSEIILKVEVDFGEYSKFIKYNMVPVWNIKEMSVKTEGFPVPCIDKVNYEHVISTVKEGNENGYLVDTDDLDVNYIIFRNSEIVISSDREKPVKWNILKFVRNRENKIKNYEYRVMTNKFNVNFSNRMSLEKRYSIKTKTELIRLINSFEDSKYLKFKKARKEENNLVRDKEVYDVNNFIVDEIRGDDIKKKLILEFEPVDKEDYLNYDILSFLICEVQLIYPEYECEGRLI